MRKGENIYKRTDGRWEARYKNGFKKDGTTKYSSVYGKTYSEVKQKRDEVLRGLSKPKPKKNKLLLNDLYMMYYNYLKYEVKYSSLGHYDALYNKHIAPCLGGCKIVCIDSDVINNFIDKKLETLSKKYTKDMVILLLAILEFGKEQNLIDTKYKVKKIKVKSPKIEVFNDEELKRLECFTLSNISLMYIGILLARFCGLRIGEICAIRIYDIDFKNEIIRVNKTVQRVKNLDKNASTKTKIIEDTPKSEASIRDVPVPHFLMNLIKNAIKGLNCNAYLLTGSISFIEPRTLENRYKEVLKKCKIDYKKFHTLRHTFATECVINQYYDIKTLSEILGHSSVKITLDRYVHSSIKLKNEGVQKINNAVIHRHNSVQNQVKNAI